MRRLPIALLAFALLAVGCGDDGGAGEGAAAELDVVPVADRSRPGPDDDPVIAGGPMLDLGARLLGEVAPEAEGNPILSPASIAIALAMMEPGTVDAARAQVRELLGIEDPAAYHAAMNALEQSLEARVPP